LYTDDEIKKNNISYCDVCRALELTQENQIEAFKKDAKCCFCFSKEGVLKKIREKKEKWTHLNCVSWFGTSIKLVRENGFSLFKVEKPICSGTWTETCHFCNKTAKEDFFVKCSGKTCNKYYHTKCVQNNLKENINLLQLNEITAISFWCEECSKEIF
jgi:hypothetical protein